MNYNLTYLRIALFQTDEELDPEDIEDEDHCTFDTRSRCKY